MRCLSRKPPSPMSDSTRGRMSLTSSGSPTPERTARRPWRYGERNPRTLKISRSAVTVATELGCTPKTAQHLLSGRTAVNLRAAAIVRALRGLGDQVRLARFLAPILAAQAGADVLPLTDALEREAVQAAHEDVEAVLAFEQEPSDATRRQLIRAIDREWGELLRLRAALLGRDDA
jgi:hypothetical protein